MSLPLLFVGMDVHRDSVTIAVLPEAGPIPLRMDRVPNEEPHLKRYMTKLARDGTLRACYEASSVGYVLHRQLTAWGMSCAIIAPSMTPRRPGEQRKTDRRDALELARLFRSGDLVEIRVPTELEEQVRDLVRCREILQREIIRSRHYITAFLLRRGFVYRSGATWTPKHMAWIRRLLETEVIAADDSLVLAEYLTLLEYKLTRRDALDVEIERRAVAPLYAATVARLRCFRGISTLAAMVLATEIGDWRRFTSPRELMAFLGLVPREHSSGTRERRGGITKAGNSRCRHILVQAAWSYRRRPFLGGELHGRQLGQTAGVVAHAWKAQQRLYKRYHRLVARRTPHIAAVGVARELVGFLWGVMHDFVPPGAGPSPINIDRSEGRAVSAA